MFAYTAATLRLLELVSAAQRALDPDAIRQSEEGIHDLRVALRRLRSVLRPFRPLYHDRGLAPAEVVLRRFAGETGALRDEEVLRETLRDIELDDADRAALARWQVGRLRREQGLRERVATFAMRSDALSPRTKLDVLARMLLHAPRQNPSISRFVDEALASAEHRLSRRMRRVAADDVESLHAARIAAKKVRYLVEFARALGPSKIDRRRRDLEVAEKVATRIQKRLGTVHDFDAARAVIPQALTLRGPTREAIAHALDRGRDAAVARALDGLGDDVARIVGALRRGRGDEGDDDRR